MENALSSPDSLLASLLYKKTPDRLVLLTGPSGSGKTTLCARLAALGGEAGLSVAGILCPAVYEGGLKVAIDQLDLSTGERQRLGERADGASEGTVGRWRMDERVIARGNEILARIADEDLILIDELGPLELEDGGGYRQALSLLDEGRYRRALAVVRPALLGAARARWPRAETVHLEGVPG